MTGADAIGTEFSRVLTRWNPSGVTRLRAALETPDPQPRVRIVADHGVDVDAVVDRLRGSCPDLPSPDRSSPDRSSNDAPAGVALVLLDASAPMGRAMLTRLRRLPASVRVVTVLDGIDRHHDWDVVAARNRTLLAEHVPRLAGVPMRPVASQVIDQGSELAGDLAAATSGSAADWESRNLLCLVDDVVGEARRSLTAHAQRAGRDDDLSSARAERAALIADRMRIGGDRTAFVRSRIQRVRLDALHDVGVEIRAVATSATRALDNAGPSAMRAFPVDFAHEIDTAAERLDRSVIDRLEIVRRDAAVPGPDSALVIAPADIGPVPTSRPRGADEWLAGLIGVSAGAGCARVLGALTGPPPVLAWILTAVLAVAIGATAVVVRRRAGVRSTLRRWAAEIVADARPRWEQSILSALLDVEASLMSAVAAQSREKLDDVDRVVAGVDERIRILTAAIAGRTASYERDLAALERGADAVRRVVEPHASGVRPSS